MSPLLLLAIVGVGYYLLRQDPIVGKWSRPPLPGTIDFRSDGTIVDSTGGAGAVGGTWKTASGKVTVTTAAGANTASYSVSGNQLTMSDPATGAAIVFTRVQ